MSRRQHTATFDLADAATAPAARADLQHLAVQAALRFNAANADYRAGRWAEARTGCRQALALDPALVVAALLLARCEVQAGALEAARDAYAAVLRLDPDQFSAWLELGNVCRRLGEPDRAVQCYERAAAVQPDDSRGHLACVRALEEIGSPLAREAAARHLHRALALAGPGPAQQADVLHTLGRFRLDHGDVPRALEALRSALLTQALQPDAVPVDTRCELFIDLGEALLRLGLADDAHAVLTQASQAESEATLTRLAQVSFRYNLWQEAVAVLRRSVALHPDSALAHHNLAHMLTESWQLDEAMQALDAAQAQSASPPDASAMRAALAGKRGDADTALRHYKALFDAGETAFASSVAMSSLYSDTLTPGEVAALHRELFAALGTGARSAASFHNDRDPDRPLRIGLVSADFHHQHPVNLFMQPLLARWDAARLPLTVYFTGHSHDDQTQRARARVGTWREMTQASAAQFARQVEADGIDILIDLAGHTSLQRMALFAQRMAPVQATFLGYPGSTGVPHIDWIIGDPVVTPPAHDALYSERVARLPHTVFCYAPEDDYPDPPLTEATLARPLTFGSFNNVPKLTPRTIALWARVLQAVPDARLLLKAPSFQDRGACERYRQLFAAHGVASERLEFRGPVGLAAMMAEYADVDIGLDPLPYNGGTTTLQALWMGVPVVVQQGGHFVSRMGASFMQAAGMDAWVAADDDHYVAIARQMAADRPALLALKRGLRQRLLSRPGWNPDTYTRDFGALLRQMWHQHLSLLPPP